MNNLKRGDEGGDFLDKKKMFLQVVQKKNRIN